jgi:hypothetical protein
VGSSPTPEMEAAGGGFRGMVGDGRPTAGELEEDRPRRRFEKEDGRRKKKSPPSKGCAAPPPHHPGWSIGAPGQDCERLDHIGYTSGIPNSRSLREPNPPRPRASPTGPTQVSLLFFFFFLFSVFFIVLLHCFILLNFLNNFNF